MPDETVTLWECPDCAFAFDAMHVDAATGTHSCPCCAEARLTKEVADLRARLGEVERERDEMRTALAGVGIVYDTESDPDGAVWTTCLEPHGEEPADSLAEAIERATRAAQNDRERAVLATVERVLADHWLTEVQCFHETKRDVAHCYCTGWASNPQPSVGAAVAEWVAHVRDAIDAARGEG